MTLTDPEIQPVRNLLDQAEMEFRVLFHYAKRFFDERNFRTPEFRTSIETLGNDAKNILENLQIALDGLSFAVRQSNFDLLATKEAPSGTQAA